MADSFFGFNTSLSLGVDLVDEPELDEEEYDALNDETFGADAFQGDWEEDHTKFAEVTENSRTYRNSYNSDIDDLDLEASLSQLVLEGEEKNEEEVIEKKSKYNTTKSVNNLNDVSHNYIGVYNSTSTWGFDPSDKFTHPLQVQSTQKSQPIQSVPKPSTTHFLPPQIPRIPTVQELEKNLVQLKSNNEIKYVEKENKSQTHLSFSNSLNNQFQQQNAHIKYPHLQGGKKYPPGFGPPQQGHFNQPQQQELVLMRNNQNMPLPVGPLLLPPRMPLLLSSHILPPTPHPLLLSQNQRMMNPHSMIRFMHPMLMQQQQQQQQQLHQQQLHQQQKQQMQLKQMQNKIQNNQEQTRNGQVPRTHHMSSHSQHPWLYNPNRRGSDSFDEYAGLMNNRERQWLLNIQLIQLATEKPHIDDYYYMVWSKKQEKEKKLNEDKRNGLKQNREPFFANNRLPKVDGGHRERKDSERDVVPAPSPRVYVPLQFENSLGKLQCGSVTAPRKIIDLDVVPERQVEAVPSTNHRDSRKVKKILLELEKLYLWAMEVEDLENDFKPAVCPSNKEPLFNKSQLLNNIMNSYLNEDRYLNFMCIRKGKTLLLRILPHLSDKEHFKHMTDLWCRLIKSISVIVRRDQNDGILLQMYPYFRKWVNSVNCSILSIIASYLLVANIPNHGKKSSRAVSPNSGKSVLSYILTTTFGVSVVSGVLARGETIYPTLEEKEKLDWTNFILNFIKHMTSSPNLENLIPTPLDPLPANVLSVILNRSTGLHIQDYASLKRVLTAFNKDKTRS